MFLETSLTDYLESILGSAPAMHTVDQQDTARLPLFLRQRYHLFWTNLFGRRYYLAIEQRRTSEASPGEYAQDTSSLKQGLSSDVALVLPSIASYVRNRLVRQNVPFIVPGKQIFLPMLMIDLREHHRAPKGTPNKLSSVAQVIVLYHLQRKPVNGVSLREIAQLVGYSAMAVSTAQDELQNGNLCEVVKSGKTVSLVFPPSKREVWRAAEPLLVSPVRRSQWVRWGIPKPRAAIASLTALSKYSLVADDPVPTYAMRSRWLRGALENGELLGCGGRDEADARIEAWAYDPFIITTDDTVDRCSLYLSLRQSADERVQKALADLIEGFLT